MILESCMLGNQHVQFGGGQSEKCGQLLQLVGCLPYRILNLTGHNALTDQWQKRGAVQKLHFGLLTTILHRGAFGITPDEHREVKGLPKRENPREHMDRVELALSTLTEATATASHIENDSQGIDELKRDVLKAAEAGEAARLATEKALGRPVVSSASFLEASRRKQLLPPEQSSFLEQAEPDQ
jgi:hypothetical protein